MPIIESIKYKKTKRVCVVTFDTSDYIELDMDIVTAANLKKGMDISIPELDDLRAKHLFIAAKQDAYNYASYRLRSEWQIRRKLEEKYPPELVTSCLDFLLEFSLIDDNKFAIAYIKDSLLKKENGPLKIRSMLKSFGVSSYVCDEALKAAYPYEYEEEFAEKAATKKMNLISNKPREKQKASLYNYLNSKGFSTEVTRKTVEKFYP
jgi:regulatory protein